MGGSSFWARSRIPRDRLDGASVLDLAGALTLTGLALAMVIGSGHSPALAPAVALATMPVAWRRRAPLGCTIVFFAGIALSALATPNAVRCGAVFPAGLLIAYSLGFRCERGTAVYGLGIVLAGLLLESGTDSRIDVTVFPVIGVLTVGVWGGGRLVRSRSHLAGQLAARTRTLERQREETAQMAVDVEKLRVASDLDLLARERVGEIVDLADAGERAAGSDPAAALEAFAGIERFGRASLNEMRGLLGVLRSDDPESLTPRPTLSQIESLLAQARAGGRVVEFDLEGEPRLLPEEIEVSGYRILQYLLTTSLAAGTSGPVAVHLHYAPDGLSLAVTGDATEVDRDDALAAARERTSVHGGTFTVGFPSPGRRRLRAHLPAAVAHG
jgi:glucose-6-phosphate-specific signal transduction histidine kinase